MTFGENINDPCPCGSGKKYKQCCLQNDFAEGSQFLFESGSYGTMGKFMPSIACLEQKAPGKWDYYFVLVRQNEVYFGDESASIKAKEDLDGAFLHCEQIGSYRTMVAYLKDRSYVSITDFHIVEDEI